MKGHFLPGRSFHDDADLAEQCQQWLVQVNTERESDATGAIPVVRLAEEQRKVGALPVCAADYGFFDCVVVSRESMVSIESNRYSVPVHLVGRALTARIHRERIELFADSERVATHPRAAAGANARMVIPAHFEEAFTTKPRARIMVYRDWLCGLSLSSQEYMRDLCQKRRSEMTQQIAQLYDLAQQQPPADFVTALELAAEQQMYGAEYVQAILAQPIRSTPSLSARLSSLLPGVPAQQEVERDLAQYEHYVANRQSVWQAMPQEPEVAR